MANCRFKPPSSCELPSAHSFSRIETPPGRTCYLAAGDIENAFYERGIPVEFSKFFTLPGTRAGAVGIRVVDGVEVVVRGLGSDRLYAPNLLKRRKNR